MSALVYFSSASENTARFVARCRFEDTGIAVYRIPLRAGDPALVVRPEPSSPPNAASRSSTASN